MRIRPLLRTMIRPALSLQRSRLFSAAQHRPEQVEFIRQFLHDNCPRIRDYAKDMTSIYFLLQDEEEVFTLLDKLEADVITHAQETESEEVWRALLDNPEKSYKVFSHFIYHWAQEAGFAGSAKILRQIDTDIFHKVLKDRLIIKDDVEIDIHGVWTHAIQQFLVVEKHRQSNDTFLQHDPVEVYQALGNVEDGKLSPWYFMYDHPDNPGFAKPSNLIETIIKDAGTKRWPFLAMLMKQSQSKIAAMLKDGEEAMKKRMEQKHPQEMAEGVVRRKF